MTASYLNRSLKALRNTALAAAAYAVMSNTFSQWASASETTKPADGGTPAIEFKWEPYGREAKTKWPVDGIPFSYLLADNTNPNKIYAISMADHYNERMNILGVDVSEDNGATWKALWDDAKANEGGYAIHWSGLVQTKNGRLIASHSEHSDHPHGHTFASDDGGKTWKDILDSHGTLKVSADKSAVYIASDKIYKFDSETNKVETFLTPDDNPLVGDQTRAFFIGRNDQPFMVVKGGLYKIDKNTKNVTLVKQVMEGDPRFYTVGFGNGGLFDSNILEKLFVIYGYAYQPKNFMTTRDYKTYSQPKILPFPQGEESCFPTAMEEFDRHVWIGTGDGHIFRTANGDTYEYLSQFQGDWGADQITGITKTGNGNVLISSGYGLNRLLKNEVPYTKDDTILLFANAWQTKEGDLNFSDALDFNKDGKIDGNDLLVLLQDTTLTPQEKLVLLQYKQTAVDNWAMY